MSIAHGVAAVLKGHTSATNVWIAQKMNMGIPQSVSQNVSKLRASGIDNSKMYQRLRRAMLDDAVYSNQMLSIRRLFKNQDNASLSVELKTVI